MTFNITLFVCLLLYSFMLALTMLLALIVTCFNPKYADYDLYSNPKLIRCLPKKETYDKKKRDT